eukprot:1136228-Pelagomonas_calceolata.AAC.10
MASFVSPHGDTAQQTERLASCKSIPLAAALTFDKQGLGRGHGTTAVCSGAHMHNRETGYACSCTRQHTRSSDSPAAGAAGGGAWGAGAAYEHVEGKSGRCAQQS